MCHQPRQMGGGQEFARRRVGDLLVASTSAERIWATGGWLPAAACVCPGRGSCGGTHGAPPSSDADDERGEDVRQGNGVRAGQLSGQVCPELLVNPRCCRKAMKLDSPPKGVTGRGKRVSLTLAFPKSGHTSGCIVRFPPVTGVLGLPPLCRSAQEQNDLFLIPVFGFMASIRQIHHAVTHPAGTGGRGHRPGELPRRLVGWGADKRRAAYQRRANFMTASA